MKPKPLITRLRSARIVLREERSIIFESERNADGSVDADVAKLLERFDDAGTAIGEAMKLLKERAS